MPKGKIGNENWDPLAYRAWTLSTRNLGLLSRNSEVALKSSAADIFQLLKETVDSYRHMGNLAEFDHPQELAEFVAAQALIAPPLFPNPETFAAHVECHEGAHQRELSRLGIGSTLAAVTFPNPEEPLPAIAAVIDLKDFQAAAGGRAGNRLETNAGLGCKTVHKLQLQRRDKDRRLSLS